MAEFNQMPFFTDSYLADTTHLTTEEHGAYFLLLVTAWRTRECQLPDDDKLLARYARLSVAKWKKIRPVLEEFFLVENGKWIQKKQKNIRKHVLETHEKRVNAGKKGGEAKSLKNKDTTPSKATDDAKAKDVANGEQTESPAQASKSNNKKENKKRKSQLPLDCPSIDDQKKAVAYWQKNSTPVNLEIEIDTFRAHHKRQETLAACWSSAWQTWYVNGRKFAKSSGQPVGDPHAFWEAQPSQTQSPALSEDDIWRKRVKRYKQQGTWSQQAYGSEPPNSAFTTVPEHILSEFGYGKDAA